MKQLLSMRYGPALVTGLAIVLFPLVAPNNFAYDLVIRICIGATVAVALNLLIGYAGQVSLGHAGFFGMGAYASAVLCARGGWEPLVALGAGALGCGLLAYVVAKPILRLKSHYLAMATLGLGAIATTVLINETAYTGGPDGMSVLPMRIGAHELSGPLAWLALTGAVLVAVMLVADNIANSAYGRALQGLHGSEVAAQCVGVDTSRMKVGIFVFSAVVASLAGSLYAHYIGFITPQVAGTIKSVEFVTMVVVGGMGSILGGVVGAVIFTLLPQLVTDFEGYELVVFGLVLVASLVLMPRGIVPTLRSRLARALDARATRAAAPAQPARCEGVDVEHA